MFSVITRSPRHEIQDLATDRHSGIHPIQISPQHVTNDAAANGIFQFLTPKTATAPDGPAGKTELRRWPSPYRLSFSSDRIRSPAEECNFPKNRRNHDKYKWRKHEHANDREDPGVPPLSNEEAK